jgi:hypothetical protein
MAAQTYLVFRPDVWGPRIDKFFKAKLEAAKFFMDFSDGFTEGGKSLHIPWQSEYTATAITTTTGDLTGNLVTDTRTVLDIDKWYGTNRIFADFQAAQVSKNYRLKESFADAMGYALAAKLDTDILALATAANISRSVNASTAGLKSSDLESALGIIESYNIPRSECIFFFHPKAYYGEVLAVQKLYDASQFGAPSLTTGNRDSIYGVPVVVTTQVPASNASIEGGAHRNLLIHNRAFCYAIGNLPGGSPSGVRMQTVPAEALRQHYVADIMYGVKKLGNGYRGVRLISKV